MTIQGVYLEPIRKETIEFQDIDERFESKLVVLYEIIYAETVNGYLGSEDEWDGTTYYHGTSHCGCIDVKITNSQDDRIPVYAWCESAHCCTKGIINSGFLKAKSPQGHFFSQQVETARAIAISKTFGIAPESPLLSIFVCVAKNPQNAVTYGFGAYHTVLNDNEILPVYIAIISNYHESERSAPRASDTHLPDFLQYQGIFGTHNLFKLYKISYEPLGGHTLDWFNGFPSIFYHGTGHCGCLQRRASTPDLGEIRASEWCGTAACPTQGILNRGHLKVRSPRGHFFSPNWKVAQSYAYCKSDSQVLLSVFLVKTRSRWPSNQDIFFVHRDMDILPCFLAILRNTLRQLSARGSMISWYPIKPGF